MTACRRGLCLILTLWLVGSRSATAIRTGLLDSSPLWDQDPRKIQKNALRYRKAGDFLAAQKLYREGYQEASRLGDRLAAVRYLISAGGCQLLAFRYRDALSTFLEARDLAAAIRGLVHADARGFVSVTNSGTCSWFEFAQEILRQAGKNNPVKPIDTVQAARAAKRPAYSVLSPAALHTFGITVRHWREALPPYLAELRKMGKLT